MQVPILGAEATVERAYSTARGAPYFVVVDKGNQPTRVVSAKSLKSLAATKGREQIEAVVRGPDFLIAEITTTFKSVMDQVDALGLDDSTFVVVTGSSRGTVGVTTIERLRDDLFHRRLAGSMLPGRPKIPPLVRSCKYLQSQLHCAHRQQFQSRPQVMPPCANPLRLTSHTFVW